ncbi:MAG TPA: photosynthetic reaction center cytochrome c subunit family protein [Gemmatimonadaceae bacterium]|nr:photosynthetic reaction center cytochrome c subunit family protein [Gemmatimonadaceae bacterium]
MQQNRSGAFAAVCGVAVLSASLIGSCGRVSATAAGAPGPVVRPTTARSGMSSADSIQASNDSTVRELLADLGARATMPAESAFQNVQIPWLKPTPANRFLSIMNGGYAKALGVRCEHCHVTSDFSLDDKRPKLAAREMAVMHKAFNDALQNMKNAATPKERRFINCSTCHRGQINPLAAR